MVSYGEQRSDGEGFVLEIVASLRGGDLDLPSAADLPTIVGPVAKAVQTLASSDRIVGTLMNKAGYAIVTMPAGAKWMTAHGREVAQVFGKGSQAGSRALVVGGGLTAVALAPELLSVGAALAAEYVLVAKIEQAGRVASLVHQRQVSEALAAGDTGRALVERTRRWSDDPRQWPEVLVRQLVDCHAQLKFQAQASNRMRDLVLNVTSKIAEDKARPVKPGSGDAAAAGAELTAGYEVHASAAQVAAVRLEHALAHGDEETAAVLLLDLAQHLDDLREHHRILTEMSSQRGRWLRQKWGDTIEKIAWGYAPLVERLSSGGQFLLTIGQDGAAELRALPPGSLELPETTGVAIGEVPRSSTECSPEDTVSFNAPLDGD